VSKSLIKKLKGSGMNEDDLNDFLFEQKMLASAGGSITNEMVHEAFENSKKSFDHLLDVGGFLAAVQELKNGNGVDKAKLDELTRLVDSAQRRNEDAAAIHDRLSDARGQMRTTMVERKVKLARGDALVKQAQLINLSGLDPEQEVVVLQKVLRLMHGALDRYAQGRASQTQVVPIVKRVIHLNVRLGRLEADLQNFRHANTLLRQVLILCKNHNLATSSIGAELKALAMCEEVQEAVAFAQEVYAYAKELEQDGHKCLEAAQKNLLLQDFELLLLALLASESFQADSLHVRGIPGTGRRIQKGFFVLEMPVVVIDPEAVKHLNSNEEDELLTRAKDKEWTWVWVQNERTQLWQETADKAIETMFESAQIYLSQGNSREAKKILDLLVKFTSALNLPNPALAITVAVETGVCVYVIPHIHVRVSTVSVPCRGDRIYAIS